MTTIDSVFSVLKLDATGVSPVGNHALKRHQVYKFVENNQSQIIKIYYKKNRIENEIYAYQHTKAWGVPTADVVDFGELSDGRDYMILTELPGVIMAEMSLSRDVEMHLYYEMGRHLGRMHSVKINLNQDFPRDSIHSRINTIMQEIAKLPLEVWEHNLLISACSEYQRHFEKTDFSNLPIGFCHNDFDSRNVLIANGKIAGIIDFEISGYGYIENDLINLQRKVFCNDEALAQAFFKGYSQYNTLDMALYHARMKVNLLADAIENCSWAFDQAKSYFDENIAFLKTILT